MWIIKKICLFILCFLFLPVIFLIRLIQPFFLIRLGKSHSSRLGHFVGINSYYLMKRAAGINKPNSNHLDIFVNEKKVSNKQIEALFAKKMIILPWWFQPLLIINEFIPWGSKNKIFYSKNPTERDKVFEHRDVYGLFDKSPQQVFFSDNEIKKAVKELKEIGIDKNEKIVTLCVRDSGYLQKELPQFDFFYKTQDAEIKSFEKAINTLLNLGFKVVRTGLYHKNKLIIKNKNYVDLFESGKRTDLLEVFLYSICKFHLGTYSGGTAPSIYLFRKPVITTNQVPINELHPDSRFFYLFKKVFDKKKQKKLSISEIFDLLNSTNGATILNGANGKTNLNGGRYLISKENPFNEYTKEDIVLIENTEDEINKIVIELAEYVNKNNLPDPDKNELNNLFLSVFEKNLKRYPRLYEFHPKKLKFNVGSDFLNENKDFVK